MLKSFRRQSKKIASPARPAVNRAAFCTVENLESRRLFSTWSPQDIQVGINTETANYPSITGKGEAIVVIDNGGVDYNHYALGSGYGNKVVYGWDYDTNSWDVEPYDNNAHATGVAGEAAGTQHVSGGLIYQGVAPGANIIALRASGSWNVKQAFDWVVANRAKYNIVGVNYTDETGSVDQTQIYGDLTSLTASGVMVSAPVGNYGPGTAYGTYNNGYYEIGSVNSANALSSFTPRGSAVNLVAPGENVMIDWYANGVSMDYPSSGTSWSSPQVVGLAALIHQVNPSYTVAQEMQIMKDSGTSIWDGYSNQSYIEINANAAVALAYSRAGISSTGGLQSGSTGSTGSTTTTTTATTSTPFSGTPAAVGSVVLVANYDNGGQGVAYNDTTAFNEGSQTTYRSGNVDTGWSSSQNTEYVGWAHTGEWMNYTMNAAAAGTYNLAVKVAGVGTGAAFHFEVDGKNISGSVTVPNTGAWDTYQTVTIPNVTLTAGNHVVRLVMDSQDTYGFTANFTSFQFVAASSGSTTTTGTGAVGSASGSSSTAFLGSAFNVGALIPAADYDNGGEGVAYHDTTAWNEGDQTNYRTGNVDLGWTSSEGGLAYVGWTHAGEWMNYTVNAPTAGTESLAVRVADAGSGASFHVEVDGKIVGSSVAIPNTGSWTTYSTVTIPGISLTAGNHIVRLVMDTNDQYGFAGNFATLQLNNTGSTTTTGTTGYTPATSTVPNGPFGFYTSGATKSTQAINFYDTANNESGYQILRSTSAGGTYSAVATVSVDQPTSQGTGWRSWTDSNLSAGTTYYYKVVAVNQNGQSSATTGSGTTTWS